MREEREHKNLFTQFGLMMTYSGGESSSPFHIWVFLQRDIEIQESVFKPNSTQIPASSRDQETQS